MSLGGEAGRRLEQPVVEAKSVGDGTVARLAGELDLYNAEALRTRLLDLADAGPERLVVDLSEVQFIDSTALGVLIEIRSTLPNRRAFLLASPGRETRRALEVSGLDQHLTVYDTVDDALAASL